MSKIYIPGKELQVQANAKGSILQQRHNTPPPNNENKKTGGGARAVLPRPPPFWNKIGFLGMGWDGL